MRAVICRAEFGPKFGHDLDIGVAKLFENGQKRRKGVASVGIVIVNAGDGFGIFEELRGHDGATDRLHLVVHTAKGVRRLLLGFRQALLRGAVPRQPELLQLRGFAPNRLAIASGNDTQHGIAFLRQCQLVKTLHHLFGAATFVFKQELHFAAENAALIIDLFGQNARGPGSCVTEDGGNTRGEANHSEFDRRFRNRGLSPHDRRGRQYRTRTQNRRRSRFEELPSLLHAPFSS